MDGGSEEGGRLPSPPAHTTKQITNLHAIRSRIYSTAFRVPGFTANTFQALKPSRSPELYELHLPRFYVRHVTFQGLTTVTFQGEFLSVSAPVDRKKETPLPPSHPPSLSCPSLERQTEQNRQKLESQHTHTHILVPGLLTTLIYTSRQRH